MSEFKGFHPGEYLADEIAARGWSRNDLAFRMADGSDGDLIAQRLVVDLLLGPPSLEMHLGAETAAALAKAMGQEAETWLSLDRAWHEANA